MKTPRKSICNPSDVCFLTATLFIVERWLQINMIYEVSNIVDSAKDKTLTENVVPQLFYLVTFVLVTVVMAHGLMGGFVKRRIINDKPQRPRLNHIFEPCLPFTIGRQPKSTLARK